MATVERLFYRINEAVEATGVPRSTIYELIRRGEIRVSKLGSRTLVDADSLREWAERLKAGTAQRLPVRST